MLIFIGPDGSGKTTIAQREFSGLDYYHFTKDSKYTDYIQHLVNLDLFGAVLDRHAICEYPYSVVMERRFKFTDKQWHNILLLTFIQNPVIVLFTRKPPLSRYEADQYMPYTKWDQCLDLYRRYLNLNRITYYEYDFTTAPHKPSVYGIMEAKHRNSMRWWIPMWQAGIGCIGSANPEFLLVAERIGPNNMNNIPFETGPTGLMLSDVLSNTHTPLGHIAITNMVKDKRRSTRAPNSQDLDYLDIELTNLKPKKVIFMGKVAQAGIEVAKKHGIPHSTIIHLGALNHQGIKDLSSYCNIWKRITSPSRKDIL